MVKKKIKNETFTKNREIWLQFELWITFLLLSIVKINIFNEKRIFLINYR